MEPILRRLAKPQLAVFRLSLSTGFYRFPVPRKKTVGMLLTVCFSKLRFHGSEAYSINCDILRTKNHKSSKKSVSPIFRLWLTRKKNILLIFKLFLRSPIVYDISLNNERMSATRFSYECSVGRFNSQE